MKKLIIIMAMFIVAQNLQASSPRVWKDVSSEQKRVNGIADINTKSARLMQLDLKVFSELLMTAPLERSGKTQLIIELPTPNGKFERFAINETRILAPELAAKYPKIKTWSGQGVDDKTATVSIDINYFGFHAMVLKGDKTYFIDPYNRNTATDYKVYFKNEAINDHETSSCGFNPESNENIERAKEIQLEISRSVGTNSSARSIAGTLRTYRLALACTGEYATFFGGTKPGALSGMVTSINRVNGVYEKEVDVRMILIGNTDTLIYLNASTDPYTNNDGGAMLGQNQSTVNSIIGSANYDFGHVFSTGGGGIAGLGVICGSSKAQGVTGSFSPVGDPFDIDYVAHEMGHQFGGNHTFNGNTGACTGNRNASTAYEPGSGSSIMAYAGICAPQDIANNSDPIFHTASFDEIVNYSTLANGNSCAVQSPTGNNAPIITSVNANFTIPISTPFSLTGTASDPDGDTLTYLWEQYDLGPAGAPTAPVGNAPIFRSRNPIAVPTRYFPNLSNILSGQNSPGEVLPSYARNLKFRFTVRDNKVGGGGVTYNDTLVVLSVVNNGGAFLVTQPNTLVTWPALSQQNVTWDVSGTDLSPINAANVDVLLSDNAGSTFNYILASNVPNSGLASVTMPNINTTLARIMVRPTNNIFFDISNRNFKITTPQAINENEILNQSINVFPNPSKGELSLSWAGDYKGIFNVTITDAIGKSVFAKFVVKTDVGLVEKINIENVSSGVYFVNINSEKGKITRKLIIE